MEESEVKEAKQPEEAEQPVEETEKESFKEILSKVEEGEKELPFANAEVVRLMKKNLSPDKMIRKQVKVAMNFFLSNILAKVCERMDENPYVMMDYSMFKEATRPYENIEAWELEKQRVVKYLHKIKADCDHLIFAIQGLE